MKGLQHTNTHSHGASPCFLSLKDGTEWAQRERLAVFCFVFSVLRVALGKPAQRALLMWSSDFILFCFCAVSVCLGSAVCFAYCFLCCVFLIVHSVPAECVSTLFVLYYQCLFIVSFFLHILCFVCFVLAMFIAQKKNTGGKDCCC